MYCIEIQEAKSWHAKMGGVHKPKMANKGTVIWMGGSFLAFNVDFNNLKP